MPAQKAAPPKPRARSGAQGNASMLDRSSPIAKPSSQRSQAVPIRAELVDNLCTAAGLTARGFAPVIALCRELVAAGFHPSRPLHCYRGDSVALVVCHIGESARLHVGTHGVGFEPAPECTGGSPVRQNAEARTIPPVAGGMRVRLWGAP